MKIMIASDIHGSAKYCEMLLDAYRREGAERMLLLGDILYHGPRNDLPEEYAPKKVIEMLNAIKNEIYAVRGNCEAEVDRMVLGFPVLADYALIPIGEKMIFATHGHVYNRDNLPPMKSGDILLHGHTHIPACERFGECIYMNPGSVSLPKNNSPHGYMTLEENDAGENPGGVISDGVVLDFGMLPGPDFCNETAAAEPQRKRRESETTLAEPQHKKHDGNSSTASLWIFRWKKLV